MKRVIVMPGNWDLAYLQRYNGKDNTKVDFATLARNIASGFTAFNASLKTGYLSKFVTTTSQPTIEYGIGNGSERLPRMSERTRADPIVGDSGGHMLPMYDFGGALAWTYMTLRRSNMSKFDRDISALVSRGRNSWEYELMNRLFSKAVVSVAGGKSLPLADGGASDNTFVPESNDGRTFDNTANHYRRYTDDAAGRIQYLSEAGTTLMSYGIKPGFELIIPEVDTARWAGLNDPNAKFSKPERGVVIVTNGVETRARVDENDYIGVIETNNAWFFVHTSARVPAGYAHSSRAYGYNAPGNPLAVRYEEGYEMGLSLVAEIKHYPFEEAQALCTFGAGIGNRINGFNGKFAAAGIYTDPTIS